MKKNLLSLLAISFAAVATGYAAENSVSDVTVMSSTQSQSWVGEELGNGEFFLYNIGAQNFLGAGNAWGTQGTFGTTSILMELNGGNGVYTICSKNEYTNGVKIYLGEGGFVDQNSYNWTFTDQGNNVYTITNENEGKVLGYDGTTALNVLLTEIDDNAKWLLLSKNQRIKYLENATVENALDATFLITNPNFNRSSRSDVWSGESSDGNTNFPAINGDNTVENRPYYVGEIYKGSSVKYSMYQQFENIPNGKYTLECKGFYRDGSPVEAASKRESGDEILGAYIFANESKTPLMSIFNKEDDLGYGAGTTYGFIPNTMAEAAKYMIAGYYGGNTVEVTVVDNKLKVGIMNDAESLGSNWCLFDDFKLTYHGIDLTELQNLLNSKIEEIKEIDQTLLTTGIKAGLNKAIEEAEGVKSTVDAIEHAIAVLNEAIKNVEESAAVISAINELEVKCTEILAVTLADESFSTFVASVAQKVDEATSVDELEAVNAELRNAYAEFLLVAVPTEGNILDYTFLIEGVGNSHNGWQRTHSSQNFTYKTSTEKNTDELVAPGFIETWNGSAYTGRTFFVKEGLRQGHYTISAFTFDNTMSGNVAFYANSESVMLDNTTNMFSLSKVEDVVVYADGRLEFGLNIAEPGSTWMGITNITLGYKGDLTSADFAEGLILKIEEAKALPVTNAGDNSFQYSSSYADALNEAIVKAEAALEAADYNVVVAATGELAEAISAYNEKTLNIPAADEIFNAILTFEGWGYDNMAVTFIANDRNDHGLYNIKYLAPANKNYAQAFNFIAAEESDCYTMSMIDVDGVRRYISTGVPHGGNSSQIRTVTDETKALVVKVIATDREGVYNLYNTEAKNYIGSQDAGVYTVNSHIDFKLEKAEKAVVTIATDDFGYSTVIVPFKAEIPSEMNVYTYENDEEFGPVLVEVYDMEANTPYVVKAVAGDYVLTGTGAATKDSYSKGLLAGTYEEVVAPENSYIFNCIAAKVGFYQIPEGVEAKVAPYSTYMTLDGGQPTYIIYDDVLTSIENVNATAEIVDVYGIDGIIVRKAVKRSEALQGLGKGIYIVGGEKVAVK